MRAAVSKLHQQLHPAEQPMRMRRGLARPSSKHRAFRIFQTSLHRLSAQCCIAPTALAYMHCDFLTFLPSGLPWVFGYFLGRGLYRTIDLDSYAFPN
ncbi:hypothetical protein CC78DRAFT_139573 [Lojkania enalia]|uniref:Uncharacterized protein n=1 Tax=Lojkania enalia TaxID=147567 RepID=A0A9P4NCG7_9PLEO|nr:hypothetical protein CC78DRAFT_139573 [Didymosphaeria enalia]